MLTLSEPLSSAWSVRCSGVPGCEEGGASASRPIASSLSSVGVMLCVSEPERALAVEPLRWNLRKLRRLGREVSDVPLETVTDRRRGRKGAGDAFRWGGVVEHLGEGVVEHVWCSPCGGVVSAPARDVVAHSRGYGCNRASDYIEVGEEHVGNACLER